MQRKGRVLIVDDNEPLAENLLELFEDEGMEGAIFTDPTRAVASIGEGAPVDLVVTDFRMPQMDGVEVVRKIKQARPEVPVIMLSAYVGDVDADAAREAGVVDVLRKPEDLQKLVDRVRGIGQGWT